MSSEKESKQDGKILISLNPVSGTRDFLPEDMRRRRWLFSKWHETAKVFGFEEYDCPILESKDLYTVKSGDEICSQMYHFVDNSGQEVALRPEMTPSLARLVMKAGRSLLLPVKWYSVPQCWRWETTSRGRKREFYQWNMDILGVRGIGADAEILASSVHFCKSLGLTSDDVSVRLSSRKILDSYLRCLGIEIEEDKEMFVKICSCVDKLGKLKDSDIEEMLDEVGVEEEQVQMIMKFCKVGSMKELEELTAQLDAKGDEEEEDEGEKEEEGNKVKGRGQGMEEARKELQDAMKEVTDLFGLMDRGYKMRSWLKFDTSIVRGLAYYNGIVFELFVKKGINRAIAGGGRYDTLVQSFGDDRPMPAVGYGLGDVVIMEVLKDKKMLPSKERELDDFIIPFNPSYFDKAVDIACKLREKGRIVDVAMKKYRRIKTAFSFADRCGAERVIFVAPSEWEKGMVKVKYLRKDDEKEEEVKIEDL